MAIDNYVPPPLSAVYIQRLREVLDRDFSSMPAEGRARMAADLAADLATVAVAQLTVALARKLTDPEVAGRYGIEPVMPGDGRLSSGPVAIPGGAGNVIPRRFRGSFFG